MNHLTEVRVMCSEHRIINGYDFMILKLFPLVALTCSTYELECEPLRQRDYGNKRSGVKSVALRRNGTAKYL